MQAAHGKGALFPPNIFRSSDFTWSMVVIIAIASVSSKRPTNALPGHADCVIGIRWAGGRSGCAKLAAGDVFPPLAANHHGQSPW
jgi:hypothetical protein